MSAVENDLAGLPDPERPSNKPVTVHESAGLRQRIEKTARATNLQWIGLTLLGGVTLGVGGFLAWCLITMGALGQAQAQTSAKADSALEQGKTNSARIEAVDAGTRQAIERLERKIDANDVKHDQQVQALDQKLDLVLREIRKR